MSDKTNEKLEREARESLVASDLSAKMKQWKNQPPAPENGNNGGSKLPILLLLLALSGAAWWLWPESDTKMPGTLPSPVEQPAPVPDAPAPATPEKSSPVPMAQKTDNKRYLALAQSSYRAPNFSSEIRGDAASPQDALNDARQALAARRPADALDALQNVPAAYRSDADYLRAHALFALKKYDSAAEVFGRLSSSVRYGEAAQWFQVLAMLPNFEREAERIRTQLKAMAEDEGHTFHREAQQLAGAL